MVRERETVLPLSSQIIHCFRGHLRGFVFFLNILFEREVGTYNVCIIFMAVLLCGVYRSGYPTWHGK